MAKKPDVQYICYQTEGSAARKLEFLRPRPKTSLPALKKKKATVIRLNPLATLGTLMSLIMLILMIVSGVQITGLQEDTKAMHRYVNDLRAENNEQIIDERKLQNITQAELAKRVGTQKSNISRLESGNYNPSLDFLTKVARSLGKEISMQIK